MKSNVGTAMRISAIVGNSDYQGGSSFARRNLARCALDSLSAQIAILDAKGNILAVNQAWLDFSGDDSPLDSNRALGANYLDICDRVTGAEQEEARLAAQGIRTVLSGAEKVFTMEYFCDFPLGRQWFILRATAFHDNGDIMAAVSHEDITERKEADIALTQMFAALMASEARLAEAQRVARIGSWEYEIATGKITWSEEMFRLFDMAPLEGEPGLDGVKAKSHPDDLENLTAAFSEARLTGGPCRVDGRVVMSDGSPRWMHTTFHGGRDDSGRIVRLYGTCMDIHERKMLEAAERAQAEQLIQKTTALRMVLDNAPMIVHVADLEGTMTLSEGLGLKALGLTPGEAVGMPLSAFTLTPESIENTRRAFAGETVSYEANFGGLWFQTELSPVLAEDGSQTGIVGVSLDVTERIASEQRFRVLFECSSDAHLLLDSSGIFDCNNAAVAMLRCRDKSEVLSLHPAVFSPEFQPDGRRSAEKSIEMDAIANQTGQHRFEWIHRKMDGEDFPVEVTLTPVTIADKPALLVVWHDLTERVKAEAAVKEAALLLEQQKIQLERANEKLEQTIAELGQANSQLATLATTDGLTGLVNRRAFQSRLNEEVRRAMRYGSPLSLIMVDVDRFKRYNDVLGHPAGDAVLKTVARVLETCSRDGDLASRYGGEEFVILLPHTDIKGAAAFAERARAAVESEPWSKHVITASFGVASLRLGDVSGADLLERADAALYRSKEDGRNRVTCAGD